MSDYLRRCGGLAMSWNASTLESGVGWQDYANPWTRKAFQDTHTRWLRIWAHWPSLEPTRGNYDQKVVGKLENQIALARNPPPGEDPRSVILVMYRYPGWANGTAAVMSQPPAKQNEYHEVDRILKARRGQEAPKELEAGFPTDVSTTGDWARFMRFLLDRWGTRIQGLEICNEPNKDNWPQQASSNYEGDPWGLGNCSIGCQLTQMLQTAVAVLMPYSNPKPWLLGPAFTDAAITNSRVATTCQDATSLLLDAFDMYNWKAPGNCIFTHHNYWDVENDPADAANKTAQVRSKLVGRWTGWPGSGANASNPELWITEGGVQIGVLKGQADVGGRHGYLLQRNWDRMHGGPSTVGEGVGMISQYQFVTEADRWDSGIAEPPPPGGTTPTLRQKAWDAWKNMSVYP
jgi:hypothetical protein